MTTKHTPGPWAYSPQKGKPGHCNLAQVWRSDGKCLATLTSTKNEGEATADACLIAAAPDMLEALEKIAAFDDGSVICTAKFDEMAAIARAAIKKSKGEK